MPNPTQEQINMWDLNQDKKLDWDDVDFAKQIGATSMADNIRNILETGTANFDATEAGEQMGDVTSGQNIKGMIETSAMVTAQTQASDIQLNAMPSLPAISSVGTVAPTGAINWNAIPGGFQPLPQTAGGKKKLYQLSQFHGGVSKKSSPRDIADFECQDAINVSVSQAGKIKLLGDCQQGDNSQKTMAALNSDKGSLPGYGLFEFTAPADHDDATEGEFRFILTADGDQVDALDTSGDGVQTGWIDIPGSGTTDNTIAQIYYAAGNGLYVADATWQYIRQVKIYTKFEAQNGTVAHWSQGDPLIASPLFENASNAVAGKVNIRASDTAAANNGSLNVNIIPTGTGTWDGEYYFYVSWLFDYGVETGLTAIGTDTFVAATTGTLVLNPSLVHTAANPLGGDGRIEGGRIYFKKAGDAERWLLAEFSLEHGVKGALDSTFIPWTIGSNVHDLVNHLVFVNPPEVYSYASLNGYYANETYSSSSDLNEDDDGSSTVTGPTAKQLDYKTCVVGQNGIVFVGNIRYHGDIRPDSMMFSMPGKPGVFPKFNIFDSPSSDGSPITALAAFQDTILQFKQNSMYVINVSNPAQFYAEKSFRDCGVFNPCQVFTTSFGVIFVNKHGCFIYDGQKVISLTNGKFDWLAQSYIGGVSPAIEQTSDASGANFPSVGYDPRSQSIIVLKDIGHTTDSTRNLGEGAWVYNMTTQSWTEGNDFITNGNGHRHTNFIITSEGYLTLKSNNAADLINYNHTPASAQIISYQTKDMDFGLPSQTKKLFKVYVTFKGNPANITVTFGVDGAATTGTTNLPHAFDASGWSNSSTLSVATFTPNDSAEGKDWKSLCLRFDSSTSTVATTFEINDIAILYRPRPIK